MTPRPADPGLLELLGDAAGLLDLVPFRAGLLRALRRAVPADWISLNEVGREPGDAAVLVEPPFPPEAHVVFTRLAGENPLLVRYRSTRDGRAHRLSDVGTPAELHATALHRELYGPIGLEHQIAFVLSHPPDRLLAVALSRARGRPDFSDGERDLLNAARPFLIQAYRNAIEHTRLRTELAHRAHDRRLPLAEPALAAALAERGITARQAEVLSWVATGRSDRAVAEVLELSERTVQKHLQACFQKLGVGTREDATELAWSYVGQSRPCSASIAPNTSSAGAKRSVAASVRPPA